MSKEIDWDALVEGAEPKQTWREREAQSRKIGSALFPFCKDLDLSNVREMHKLLKMIVEINDNLTIISNLPKNTDPSVIKTVENLNFKLKSSIDYVLRKEDNLYGNLLEARSTIAIISDRLNGAIKALDSLNSK